MATHIDVDERAGIMRIRMNRPEKKNAITREMYVDLANALNAAECDKRIRVIFVSGTSDCFTAGNDLADFLNDSAIDEASPVLRFVNILPRIRKPIVAAVTGMAIGIGTTMLLHCDIVCASKDAMFQMPFVQLGLVPEAGSSLLLPMMVGHSRAAKLLMLGESFSAQIAYECGIVSQLYEADMTFIAAMEIAEKLCALPPESLVATKHLMKSSIQGDLMNKIDEESEVFKTLLNKAEAREAMTAFFEKRKADFSNVPSE